jgi:hypothetical protein
MRGRCSVSTNSPPTKSVAGSERRRQAAAEDVLAVQILMQAVVVAGAVLQEQRRGPRLAGGSAAGDEFGVLGRESHAHPHALVPPVGERREARIERRPQALNQGWQRIREVAVLAHSEAMPRHHDTAAKARVFGVQGSELVALRYREQIADHRPTLRVEVALQRGTIEAAHPRGHIRFDPVVALHAACSCARCSRSISSRLRSTPQR